MDNPWELEKRGGFPTMEAVCPCCGSEDIEEREEEWED